MKRKMVAGLLCLTLSTTLFLEGAGVRCLADNVDAAEEAVEEETGRETFNEAEASGEGDEGAEEPDAEGRAEDVSADESLAAGGSPDAPGVNGGGGSTSDPTWSGATTITSATTETGKTYSSTSADQNAVLISTGSGVAVTLKNPTVTKSGGTSASDDYSFYGINSAVMCKGGGTTTITGGTVNTTAEGANGVFCYGANSGKTGSTGDETTVNVSDMKITTTGNGSGGIMTTYGGTTNASNLTITTSGGSSAPIRTDRGGGTVVVDGGTYTSSGTGSPAIYSVADVTIENATLVSTASEGAVMEGGGDITLTDCDMTDTNTTANSNAKFYDAVMLYQSFSGDATGTESVFTMTGGSLTSNKGHVFHITNVTGKVVLNGVAIKNNDSADVLISVCDDGWSGASNTGYLTATDQTLQGTALVGSDSSLTVNLSGSSTWTGKTSGVISDRNGNSISTSLGTAKVYIGSGSTWVLSGDCSVSALDGYNGTYGSINYNGHTLTVGGTSYSSGAIGSIKETTSGGEYKVSVNGITLSESTLTLEAGNIYKLTADVTPENATDKTLNWTSDDESVAAVSNGTITAVRAGTATITATANDGSGVSAACKVTVTEIAPTAIEMSESAVDIRSGSGVTLSVTFTPENTTDQEVTWTTSDASVAAVEDGWVLGVNKGTAIITAASKADSSLQAACTVTVSEFKSGADPDAEISEESEGVYSLSLVKGQKTTVKSGSWSYSSSADKKIVSVTKAGLITAKAKGSATLSFSDGENTETCKVTVYAPALDKKKLTLYTGAESGTVTLGATAGDLPQTWLSSNERVAQVKSEYDPDNRTYNALIFPAGEGSATVTAYVGGRSYPVKVTVKQFAAGITPTSKTGVYDVNLNAFQSYKPAIKSSIFNLSRAGWKYLDAPSYEEADESSFVSIASNGRITGKKEGFCIAAGKDKNNKTAALNITVSAVPATTDIYVNAGKTTTLRHAYLPAKGEEWVSAASGNSILSLANTDRAAVTIKGLSTGDEDVTCSYKDVIYRTTVHVEDPGFDYDQKGAPSPVKNSAYNATLTLSEGDDYSITDYMKCFKRAALWKSSKPGVAFVDEWGSVQARSAGVTTISGKINGQTVKLKLSVTKAEETE